MYKSYHSIYALHIKQFIQTKRKLGFKYVTESFTLSKIDELASQTGENSKGITRKFADMWAECQPIRSRLYHYHRVLVMAQLSSYLNDIGIESYIPKLPRYPRGKHIPYIYSGEEIARMFRACDGLRVRIAHRESALFSFPVLLRLLYATGIRIGEALALKEGDVNPEEGYLRIQDSKNGKQRIIPISASLASVCREYLSYKALLPHKDSATGFFFENASGNKCGQSVRQWFRKCLEIANIPYMGKPRGPRIHDLRHTFAVNSLAGMAEAGIDLYASLPILSNYLGHQSIKATDHYVRLTASMFPDLIRDMDKTCFDVFPKFRNYETD